MRTTTIAILLVTTVAGCGAGAPRTGERLVTARAYLARHDLDRLLGNVFRAGLARLAVMSQPSDDAADLGQELPTGLLRSVRCDPAGARPASGPWNWTCQAAWSTVDRRAAATRYAVELTDRGCFYAAARPALPQIYDATTHAPSEHPLAVLVGTIAGC